MTLDYHIHTTLSDGRETHQNYIQKAVELGMNEIGFSEHICFKKVNWAIKPEKEPEWNLIMQKLRNDSPIPIKFGVEMDYLEGYEEEIEIFLSKYSFDYVYGSVHFINDWNFDVNAIEEFAKYDLWETYNEYFRLVQKAAKSGLFDIMTHADLIKKFNHRPTESLEEIYQNTAKAFKEANVCYELNTSGLNKLCREFYPADGLISACYKQGVPVTLGSDSHHSKEVGQHYKEAISLLKRIGYQTICSFANRNRTQVEF